MSEHNNLKNESGVYLSRIRANEKYEKTQDKIILRVPEGCRELINDWVEKKAKEEPDNPRYNAIFGRKNKTSKPSVNAFIKSLIEEATGIPME